LDKLINDLQHGFVKNTVQNFVLVTGSNNKIWLNRLKPLSKIAKTVSVLNNKPVIDVFVDNILIFPVVPIKGFYR